MSLNFSEVHRRPLSMRHPHASSHNIDNHSLSQTTPCQRNGSQLNIRSLKVQFIHLSALRQAHRAPRIVSGNVPIPRHELQSSVQKLSRLARCANDLLSNNLANQNTDNDVQPSVNDLISSLRKSAVSSTSKSSPTTITTPTLPPQIRHLLAQPETPGPRPRARDRRRFDASGRRLPAGPAPPRSWLEGSRQALLGMRYRGQQRVYPTDVQHLPGLSADEGKGKWMRDMCLRNMARDWEFIKDYERNNLVDLPSSLRMALLSAIAVYGPDDGIGFDG